MKEHYCRVCGLYCEDKPWGEDGICPLFEYCSCCGVEFGYEKYTSIDYCGNVIYETGILKRILTSEGYITISNKVPTYHYYFKDHLENNRVVADQNGTIEEVNHYYPFGGLFGESTNVAKQPYKFGGKEFDRMHGLEWYNFEARMKGDWGFTTMDPLSEKYYSISPYAYCGNNPILYVDPTGMERLLFKNGIYVGSYDDGKEEVTGFNQRSTIDENGNENFIGADNFSFNDINLDRGALENKSMKLIFMSQSEVNSIMNNSGVKEQDVLSRWEYAARESNAGNIDGEGNMDYKTKLPGINVDKTMYVINAIGYNGPDAGNYLWGFGMGTMGFTSVTARAAAHTNAWWSAKQSNKEGSTNPNAIKRWFENRSWTGDSSADQRAIQKGLNDSGSYWSAKKNTIKKLWK